MNKDRETLNKILTAIEMLIDNKTLTNEEKWGTLLSIINVIMELRNQLDKEGG